MRLKAMARKRGVSGRQIAVAAGVSPDTASRWLNGDGEPRVSELVAIADLLEVTVGELAGRSEAEAALPDVERILLAKIRRLGYDEAEARLDTPADDYGDTNARPFDPGTGEHLDRPGQARKRKA